MSVTMAMRRRRAATLRASPRLNALLLGLAALLAVTALATARGAVPVPLWSVLLGQESLTDLQSMVLLELRLPRVLLAGFVGAALGVSGAALQGLFRNPLAEPQLIGVSSGAALGAITMIVVGDSIATPQWFAAYSIPLAAIAGALAVTGALYAFSNIRATSGITTLLLLGIAINAIAGVGIGVFTWLANDGELRSLTFWTLGSFGGAQWVSAVPAMMMIGTAMLVLLPSCRKLDLLQLGEIEARRLGVSVPRLKRRLIFGTAVAVGAGVAVSGIIGFVGLVVPHIVRLLVGVHHGLVLPVSALLGAALVIAADLGARTVVVPAEMPVGLITSAIGAPFFLWLIVCRGRR